MDNEVKVTNVKSLIITFGIILTVITVGTFAWLSYRTKSMAMVLTIGDINNIQITLKPYQLNLELSPVLTYTSLDANEEYVTVSVTNNSSEAQKFNLFYDIKHIDSSLISSDFKWTLLRTNDNNITSGNFTSANTSNPSYVLKGFSIPANTTWNYRVYTWVDGTNNPNISNAVFKADFRAELLGAYIPLPDFITNNAVMDNISSTYVTNSNGVQFNDISSNTNGKGIYIRSGTENDSYPIYYYRGQVDNNHIIFANKCWRIVRTTDTGGIKLLYDGVPSNGTCNNTGNATHISTTMSVFNTSYDSLAYVGYMYGNVYSFSSRASSNLATSYKYGNSFTYSGGTYTLVNTKSSTGTWSTDYNTLNNYHYTCFNTTGTCTNLYYIFYTATSNAYYITLTGGKSVDDALSEMASNNTNSMVKTTIDTWYSNNMTSYTSYLEDTIWCNDRSLYSRAGWDPNGGSTTTNLYFSGYNRLRVVYSPDLGCTNKNDSFTVSETTTGNGDLTYPVGLLTADEAVLAGGKYGVGNNTYYLYVGNGAQHWLATPHHSAPTNVIVYYLAVVDMNFQYVGGTAGIRPSVSLKPGLTYSGSGTSSNPYTVSLN